MSIYNPKIIVRALEFEPLFCDKTGFMSLSLRPDLYTPIHQSYLRPVNAPKGVTNFLYFLHDQDMCRLRDKRGHFLHQEFFLWDRALLPYLLLFPRTGD